MSVDRVSDNNASFEQAQRFADRNRAIEDQMKALETERARLEVERHKLTVDEENKTDGILVDISKQGEQQASTLQKANSARIQGIKQLGQENFDKLANDTAKRIGELNTEAANQIQNIRLSQADKLAFVSKQSEDPFYHLATFNPAMSETPENYEIKVALPPHEAKNLFVAAEPRQVRLSLARTFQDSEKTAANMQTKSSSYQTITESIQIPGSFDPKRISREYADGILTVKLPKV